MHHLSQLQSKGNVSEGEWLQEALLLKKNKEGSEPRNETTQKPQKAGKGVLPRLSRRNSALWTLGCWPTETLVRLLAYRAEQSKSVLSLKHQQDLQTVLPQGTEERALLSRGN